MGGLCGHESSQGRSPLVSGHLNQEVKTRVPVWEQKLRRTRHPAMGVGEISEKVRREERLEKMTGKQTFTDQITGTEKG